VSLSESLPVIVTRAEPGASETMARAGGDGCSADCVSHAVACPAGRGDAGSLRRAASRLYQRQWRPLLHRGKLRAGGQGLCVGPSTAGAAREAGFAAVYEGAGDAAALAADILVALPEGTEGVLHVANEAAAGDLVARLKEGGLPAEFLALYETRPSEDLTPEAEAALAAGPACVLIHSAKGAAAFAWAAGDLDQAIVVAISEAAARPLQGREVAAIHVAEAPNEDALLATLAAVADGL
jgi:uroporphyrinogen-III synthase